MKTDLEATSTSKWTVSTDLPWNDLCVRRDGVPCEDPPSLQQYPVKLVDEHFMDIDDLNEATRILCLEVIDTEVARLLPSSPCVVTWDARRLQVLVQDEGDAFMIAAYGGPHGLLEQINATFDALLAA